MQNPDPYPKPPTLQDIAKLAGVHSRTVRDALKGTGRVAPVTRENVRRIARELQYEPNLIARALITGKTGRISILIGSLNEPYNVTAVQHLADFINQHGYETMIIQAHPKRVSAQTLRNSLSDGIIIVGRQQIEHSGPLGDHILPWVMIDAGQPDYMDHITIDLGPPVEELLNLMIASGRRRIAYVNKHTMAPGDQEVRFRTYMNLSSTAGYEPEIIIADELLKPRERIDQLKAYFRQNDAPGAIFCHNDELAVFTYRALRESGYDIPTDTLLAGCDGVEFVNYFDTPLSTITVPWEEVGEMACRFLKQRIDEPETPVQEHIITGKLVVRESLESKV